MARGVRFATTMPEIASTKKRNTLTEVHISQQCDALQQVRVGAHPADPEIAIIVALDPFA